MENKYYDLPVTTCSLAGFTWNKEEGWKPFIYEKTEVRSVHLWGSNFFTEAGCTLSSEEEAKNKIINLADWYYEKYQTMVMDGKSEEEICKFLNSMSNSVKFQCIKDENLPKEIKSWKKR